MDAAEPQAGRLQVIPLPPSTARMLDELKNAAEAELKAATRARRDADTPRTIVSADTALTRAAAACDWLFPGGQVPRRPAMRSR